MDPVDPWDDQDMAIKKLFDENERLRNKEKIIVAISRALGERGEKIEYNPDTGVATISPLGGTRVITTEEEWFREYFCELWWLETEQEWMLRHVYPDRHTVRDVTAPTIAIAIQMAINQTAGGK